jgi:hypothetical protein
MGEVLLVVGESWQWGRRLLGAERHFVPEERPERIADLVLGLTAAAPPADRGAGQS